MASGRVVLSRLSVRGVIPSDRSRPRRERQRRGREMASPGGDIPVAERSKLLTEAIDGVIDIKAFNAEVDREKKDAAMLLKLRKAVKPLLMEALAEMADDGGQAS